MTPPLIDEYGRVLEKVNIIDGLVSGESVPDDQTTGVDRLGEGVFLVRAADDGELPEVRETDVVQNAVARDLMDMSAFDNLQPGNAD